MTMQPTEDEALDAVTAAYKKAGSTDTSRPGSNARAAILADAKRVADGAALNSRTARAAMPAAMPAANDSWWNWKIAASLATLGIAGVLALQTLRDNPAIVAPITPAAPIPQEQRAENISEPAVESESQLAAAPTADATSQPIASNGGEREAKARMKAAASVSSAVVADETDSSSKKSVDRLAENSARPALEKSEPLRRDLGATMADSAPAMVAASAPLPAAPAGAAANEGDSVSGRVQAISRSETAAATPAMVRGRSNVPQAVLAAIRATYPTLVTARNRPATVVMILRADNSIFASKQVAGELSDADAQLATLTELGLTRQDLDVIGFGTFPDDSTASNNLNVFYGVVHDTTVQPRATKPATETTAPGMNRP